MHGLIMGCMADHKSGDGLDNRRANLRPCTQRENRFNSRKTAKPCTSKYKGVRFHEPSGRWYVAIQADRVRRHIGTFVTEIAAARAYDTAARSLYGDFAYLNFP